MPADSRTERAQAPDVAASAFKLALTERQIAQFAFASIVHHFVAGFQL